MTARLLQSPLQQVQQRSNALAFTSGYFPKYPYGVITSERPKKKAVGSSLRNRFTNPNSKSEKQTLSAVDELKANTSQSKTPKASVNSSTMPQKNGDNLLASLNERKLASSATSIRSFTPSVLSRKRKRTPITKLDSLPFEIQDIICEYLPQTSLNNLVRACWSLHESTAMALYNHPKFASTYRFAQFVYTVSRHPRYAQMVRTLDLSKFNNPEEMEFPIAGWREWKMRTEPLYSLTSGSPAPRPISNMASSSTNSPSIPVMRRSSHPSPHHFLKKYNLCRDVPIGAILHVVEACKRIREIDLSGLILAEDYAVQGQQCYVPASFTGLVFVSDIPKSWTWKPYEIQKVYDWAIIDKLTRLPLLEKISIRGSYWVTNDMIRKIKENCGKLRHVDFRESGMNSNMKWAIQGMIEDLSYN
ncbi:MAG: hypothetical protein M1834_004941 [Cirrosporium novae-zelandiae]|nr:MAG: hypothetical protein M1834_004941 [Cirrosporium novae-zelandiae]